MWPPSTQIRGDDRVMMRVGGAAGWRGGGGTRWPGTDTRLRRYLSKQLRAAREQWADDAEELSRIGVLQQIFLDHLPANVLAELEEVRRMELTGASLVRRLEALRERHRLNPAEQEAAAPTPAAEEVVRIVCSGGLLPAP